MRLGTVFVVRQVCITQLLLCRCRCCAARCAVRPTGCVFQPRLPLLLLIVSTWQVRVDGSLNGTFGGILRQLFGRALLLQAGEEGLLIPAVRAPLRLEVPREGRVCSEEMLQWLGHQQRSRSWQHGNSADMWWGSWIIGTGADHRHRWQVPSSVVCGCGCDG